jgi:hypothetical protein
LISESDHSILYDRYISDKGKLTPRETREEYDEIIGIPKGFLKAPDGTPLIFNLPNKKRFYNNLSKLKQTNPKATLKDVVNSGQCRYKV